MNHCNPFTADYHLTDKNQNPNNKVTGIEFLKMHYILPESFYDMSKNGLLYSILISKDTHRQTDTCYKSFCLQN